MRRPTLRVSAEPPPLALAVGGTAVTQASGSAAPAPTARRDDVRRPARERLRRRDPRHGLARRSTSCELDFPTFHTEGLVVTADHIFLSSVEIIEPTQKYPSPVDGYDRTPGKGVGHLFVMDREGHLQKDIVLGEGDMYHPGGISSDGTNIWVPVAQYRPDSSAIIYRVNVRSPEGRRAVPRARTTSAGSCATRPPDTWSATTGVRAASTTGRRDGRQRQRLGEPEPLRRLPGLPVRRRRRRCSAAGSRTCPQTPAAGGAAATYELGGMALIDLRTHAVLHEVPFQQWSTAGHVMTRNPLKLAADGKQLTMYAAPDNGEEGNGTELFTFRTDVP